MAFNRNENHRIVSKWPSWYTPVKWGFPLLSTIVASSFTAGLFLGLIPIPQAFGMLQALPVIYSSFQGISALALLGLSAFIVGGSVFVATYILRSAVCFFPAERIAVEGEKCQKYCDKLQDKVTALTEELQVVKDNAFELKRNNDILSQRNLRLERERPHDVALPEFDPDSQRVTRARSRNPFSMQPSQ